MDLELGHVLAHGPWTISPGTRVQDLKEHSRSTFPYETSMMLEDGKM